MENQHERSHSPPNKLQSLLSKVLQTVQNPQYNEDPSNYDPIISLLRSNRFFRTKLEPPANLHDFVQIAKLHVNYEVHPYGTVLMKENDLADKLYIILKGDIAKLQQRANKILDKEVQEKRQDNPGWDNNDTRHLFKSRNVDQAARRPRIKRTVTRLFNSAVSIPSLREDDEISQLKEKIHGTLTNLDARTPKARRAGLRITMSHIGHSLEDLDQEEQDDKLDISKELEPSIDLTRSQVKFESSEDDGKFSSRVSFRRLDTLSQSEINNITRNNTEEASTYRPKSLADWEDPESAGVVEEPQDLDDETKFYKHIAAKHPNIKHRMFINEIVRIERTKKYTAGESFGENFSKPQQPRENAIMAVCSKQVHVLTLTRVSYRAIMAEIVHQSYDKGVFFTQLFPSFNKELIEKFSHYFSQDSFRKGEIIYKQDDRSKRLYVLQKGDITLTKQTKKTATKTPQNITTAGSTRNLKTALPEILDLPVASITKNQFFGEEVLMRKDSRQYTATVKASETTAFFIDNKTFNRIQEGFNDLVKMLRDQAFERFAWREQRTVDLIGQKQLQTPMKNNRSAVGFFMPLPITEKHKSHPTSNAVSNSVVLPSPAKILPPLDLQSPKKGGVDFAEFPDLVELQRQRSDPNSLFYTRTNLNTTVSTNELSTLRNLETYKTKFSRKVLEEPKIRPFDSSFEHTGSKTTTHASNAFKDFNIRKELQETTPTNYKLLPKVPALNQVTVRKEKSAVKSRVLRLKKKVSEMDTSLGAAEQQQQQTTGSTPKEMYLQNKSMQFSQAVRQFFGQPNISGSFEVKSPIKGQMKHMGNMSNDYGFLNQQSEKSTTNTKREEMTQSYANIINFNDMSLERHKTKNVRIKDVGSLRAKLNRICKVKGQDKKESPSNKKIPTTSFGI